MLRNSPLPIQIDDITREWLTSVLCTRFPDTVVTELHIGTVIEGTGTKVRLLLSYNDAGHRHRLPPTMWLKGGLILHDYSYHRTFVQEAKFYGVWASQVTLNIPRAYWAGWEEGKQGLVLLEDLASRNARFTNAANGLITIDQQSKTLDLLAELHAKWWNSSVLDNGFRTYEAIWGASDYVISKMLAPDYFDRCITERRCAAYTGPYRNRERIIAALYAQWRKGGEIAQAFLHGDAHLGNMFFEQDGAPGFLDWPNWQKGPYMHDVSYSIIGNLKVEDRRHAERDLLAGYLEALKRQGVANPPSREDAWEAYRRHAMHGFMWPFTPAEMQPIEIVTAEGDCFGAAASDLDVFGALGV